MSVRYLGILLVFGLSCSEYEYYEKEQGSQGSEEEEIDSGEILEPSSEPGVEPSDDPVDEPEPAVEPSFEPSSEPGDEEIPDDGFDPEDEPDPSQDPVGNVVTILMTLSDLWIPPTVSDTLINNSVEYVSPVSQPSVLVIRDDNHNGEDEDDPEHIVDWLVSSGHNAVLMEEPADGVSSSDLIGYHVVIFSNPGYPPDDVQTVDALYAFSQQGYGVIFQGDDMTGLDYPPLEELTRLRNIDNGGNYYGVNVDNDAGDAYAVRMEPASVLTDGISLETFSYGNDIDTTEATVGFLSVAAWCTIQDTDFPEKPVITAFSPFSGPLE